MLNVSNIFSFRKANLNTPYLMPPKKIAVKGAKGKAKAASKEERKVSKSPKPVDKREF